MFSFFVSRRFFSSQNLINIDAATYNSNKAANDNVFKAAAAQSMPGTTSDDITINSVTDAPTARPTLAPVAGRRLAVAGASVIVNYVVTYNPASLGYSSSSDAYTALYNSLTTAVSTDAFTASIQAFAASLSAPDLTAAATTEVDTGPAEEVATESSDDDGSNVPLIVGLAVGLGGGFILFLAGITYYFLGHVDAALFVYSSNSANPVYYKAPEEHGIEMSKDVAVHEGNTSSV